MKKKFDKHGQEVLRELIISKILELKGSKSWQLIYDSLIGEVFNLFDFEDDKRKTIFETLVVQVFINALEELLSIPDQHHRAFDIVINTTNGCFISPGNIKPKSKSPFTRRGDVQ